ncbi:MAG: hypothetical protein ABH896_01940 [Candidatus Jacksonbacteria bacterium]
MNPSQIYIIIGIIALAIIALAMYIIKGQKPEKKLTELTTLSFIFVIAGITFGKSRLIGYSLLGIGIALAVIDIIKKIRKN